MTVLPFLNFDEFPLHIGMVKIPKNECSLGRVTASDPKTVSLPRWFAKPDDAASYLRGDSRLKLWACVPQRDLKLLDIRMMKYIMLEAMMDYADEINNLPHGTSELFKRVDSFMSGYGFKPNSEQPGEPNLPEHLEYYGLRYSIQEQDDRAVALLKSVFYPYVDGYIAPQLPFKMGLGVKFHAEICLFDPSEAQLTTTDVSQLASPGTTLINPDFYWDNSSSSGGGKVTKRSKHQQGGTPSHLIVPEQTASASYQNAYPASSASSDQGSPSSSKNSPSSSISYGSSIPPSPTESVASASSKTSHGTKPVTDMKERRTWVEPINQNDIDHKTHHVSFTPSENKLLTKFRNSFLDQLFI